MSILSRLMSPFRKSSGSLIGGEVTSSSGKTLGRFRISVSFCIRLSLEPSRNKAVALKGADLVDVPLLLVFLLLLMLLLLL